MKTETIEAIGLELADIRRSKNLSIIQVAEKTGITKDTISKYEHGNSSIKIYILDLLITFYETNIASFFTKVYDRLKNKAKDKEG